MYNREISISISHYWLAGSHILGLSRGVGNLGSCDQSMTTFLIKPLQTAGPIGTANQLIDQALQNFSYMSGITHSHKPAHSRFIRRLNLLGWFARLGITYTHML